MKHIVIIGAGAAGCFAAINAARRFKEHRYTLLEATQRPLSKVLVSGGGRCNVTHHCFEPKELVQNYPRGRKELIGSMHRFGPKDMVQWFENEGVKLKTEADGRMFPTSNSSKTIANCFLKALQEAGVSLLKGHKVTGIKRHNQGFEVQLQKQDTLHADMLMLCTGSSVVGYDLAASLGHTIEDLVPSLFTFKISHPFLNDLMGQSVSQAHVTLSFDPSIEKQVWQQQGPVLVTHWGLSGPAILKLSAFAARALHTSNYQADLTINWLPQENATSCFEKLWQHRQNSMQKMCASTPLFHFSKRMWRNFLEEQAELNWGQSSKKSLQTLAQRLTNHKFKVQGKGIFKEEFVTCGGIKRSEIDFKKMQSKLVEGLFFSGEVLDIDGITGGFNFQNAWSGSWIASQFLG